MNNLGLSYFENEDFDQALHMYTKAIKKEESAVHYNNRGLAYYHCDQLDAAEKDFNKALDIDHKDPTIYFNRGNVYLNWSSDSGT